MISAWADDLGFHRPQAVQAPPPFDSLTLKQSSSLSLRPAPSVESLFNSCRMPLTGIDEQAYEDAAKQLKVEVAVIKAVANVETKGSAFDKEGHPTILYERHYFHRLTQGKFSKKNPDISNSTSGGYGKFSAQYAKLEKAYKLAPDAALMSASWGRFQIMGANHVSAGYATVQQFVTAHMASESNHLKAFVSLLSNETRMLKSLQAKDWAKFARAYNGPKYKDNDYDTKMREAYEALQVKPARK